MKWKRSKRRMWRKIPIGIDEETFYGRAGKVATSNVGGAFMLPELLKKTHLNRGWGPSRQKPFMTRANATRRLPSDTPMR